MLTGLPCRTHFQPELVLCWDRVVTFFDSFESMHDALDHVHQNEALVLVPRDQSAHLQPHRPCLDPHEMREQVSVPVVERLRSRLAILTTVYWTLSKTRGTVRQRLLACERGCLSNGRAFERPRGTIHANTRPGSR